MKQTVMCIKEYRVESQYEHVSKPSCFKIQVHSREIVYALALSLFAVLICVLVIPRLSWASKNNGGLKISNFEELASSSIDALVDKLQSEDGTTRTVATRELFRRGKDILPLLKEAGADPIATIRPSRLDVVYSLIRGLEPGRYRRDSFGLHLEPGVEREGILRMGAQHGFSLPPNREVRQDAFPTVYVVLQPGKSLESVLVALLIAEPRVITVNLNYFTH